ncbi:MAG TPA: hypothetical protein VEU31_10605 [Candidatus Acidoferrales bacterium]|nr:hypothetical protein [Candidatus Acidoferrales bacterium]
MIRTGLALALPALACVVVLQGRVGQEAERSEHRKHSILQKQDAQSRTRRDHVGKPLPELMTGDQCLFCHRLIGATWDKDSHAWTIRLVSEPAGLLHDVTQPPAGATHLLGSMQHIRALKLTGYGTFAILGADGKTRQNDTFATRCAGCHTSGVDPTTHAFSSYALDCYACHGDVRLSHTSNPSEVWLSPKRARQPREIASICGQCHLRGGRSLSTGLPYPNNFVAGDDLFEDFQVDLKRADDASLNHADRHVYYEVRSALERGSTTTCLDCHKIHGDPALKHAICVDCDEAASAGKGAKATKPGSPTCDY